jgi:pimeloyl-ACP methyl ester carboxylesterase
MRQSRTRSRKWVPIAVLGAILVPYAIGGREPHVLDGTARASRGSEFVRLSDGYTHYEVRGPDLDDVTVLVHGTTVPSFVWDRNFEVLAGSGLRVIRYDLYGRGLSDRVEGPYDLTLYVRQLTELLDSVAPDRVVTWWERRSVALSYPNSRGSIRSA